MLYRIKELPDGYGYNKGEGKGCLRVGMILDSEEAFKPEYEEKDKFYFKFGFVYNSWIMKEHVESIAEIGGE